LGLFDEKTRQIVLPYYNHTKNIGVIYESFLASAVSLTPLVYFVACI
jgi:hypothetical protein